MPQFLEHYSRLGVSEFHVATPPELAGEVERSVSGHAVVPYHDLDVADSFTGGTSAVSAMRELAQEPGEWAVVVDLDEFVELDRPVAELLPEADAEGANVVRGIMYDRFALDGQPKAFDGRLDLSIQFPVRARFTMNVMRGADYKGVLVKGRIQAHVAHHIFCDERVFSRELEISHYKWSDRALERVRLAYEMNLAAGGGWHNEYKRILDHYAAHGRFAWETFGGEVVGSDS